MFEHIHLIPYTIPSSVSTESIVQKSLSESGSPLPFDPSVTEDDIYENLKHATVKMAGSIESFSRPPLTDTVIKTLNHMQSFSIFHCEKGCFTKRQDFDSYLFLYTYKGKGFLHYEGKSYTLLPGDFFLIDCNRPHHYGAGDSTWVHSVFHVQGPLFPVIYESYLKNEQVLFHESVTGFYHTKLEQILSLYNHAKPYRDFEVSDLLSNLLTRLLLNSTEKKNTDGHTMDTMTYLLSYMESNFTSPLTLDFLSKFAGISKYYLSREFKKVTGFSPNDYLIQLRIDHAKSLLQSTELPVKEIAHLVGIHDQNNFTQLFRKKTGVTPGAYRNAQNTSL